MEKKPDSYESMSPNSKVHEDSEVPRYMQPFQNKYELSRYGSEGMDQSGFSSKK